MRQLSALVGSYACRESDYLDDTREKCMSTFGGGKSTGHLLLLTSG